MAYTPYYAPYSRPTRYYNPSIPQENPNIQGGQQFQQIPIQQQMPMQQPIQQIAMQTPIQTMPMAQPSDDRIWVQGEAGAKAYFVAPNNTVVLWDTENPVIYIKTADMNGIPSMRVLDFIERNGNAQNYSQNGLKKHECKCGDKFATKEQLKALEGKIEDLTAKYEEISRPIIEKTKTTSKKAKESEE